MYYSAKHDLFKHCANIDGFLVRCKHNEFNNYKITALCEELLKQIYKLSVGIYGSNLHTQNLYICIRRLENGVNQFYKQLLNSVFWDDQTIDELLSGIVDLHEDVKWELLKAEGYEGKYRDISCIDELVDF